MSLSHALVEAAAREQQLAANLRGEKAQHEESMQRLQAELQQLKALHAQQLQASAAEQTALKKRLEAALLLPQTDAVLRSGRSPIL
jgi:Skp family chaperone for outer membrane proteins